MENEYENTGMMHSDAGSTSGFDKLPEIEDSQKDYIEHYDTFSEDLPPPPPEHVYDFDQESSNSSTAGKEETPSDLPETPTALGSMADQVVERVANLSTGDSSTKSDSQSPPITVYNGSALDNDAENSGNTRPDPKITLFIKAGSDRECIGCCPFSQRLFMMLWLKGVVFNVTTVDKATKPKQLRDIAAGTNPPFLLFNGEELTDIQKCEDYIEAELYPPRYPKLACKHPQSNSVGNDIFAKFSAFIKFRGNAGDPKRKMLETKLNDALRKFDKYLNEPLDDEIDENCDDDEPQVSKRKFIDGNEMTIADCNMLPKLNMIRIAGHEMLKYEIPSEFTGIARYLAAADETDEFKQTCPDPGEIIWTYGGRKPRPGGWKK